MLYLRIAVVMLAVALLGAAAYQDKDKDKDKPKDKDKAPPKLKGQLPQYYKQVGLSTDQVQRVYKIQNDYKEKMDELKRKMEQLKSDQKEAMENVLTPEQRKKLKALRSGEKPDK